jgi:GxxExxY protein
MLENEISSQIIGAAIEVHKHLGPGLLESSYEACLIHELRECGFQVKSQVLVPVFYKGVEIDAKYRLDILVEDRVIIEVKSVEKLEGINTAQLLAYLRLTELKLGLLINFNTVRLIDGVKRVANNL